MSDHPSTEELSRILEAALLAAEEPLSLNQLEALFPEDEQPGFPRLREALKLLTERCEGRGFELKEVASGFRLQVRQEYQPFISRLWQQRPPRYSRALLETLALIAYRQPVTRGEIEEIRGVAVSSNIIRTLQEREWVRIVGHRDVPGRPALFGTTRKFLDYFNLKRLDELPTLAEIRDIDDLEPELALEDPDAPAPPPAATAEPVAAATAEAMAEDADGDTTGDDAADDAEAGAGGEDTESKQDDSAPGADDAVEPDPER
ncbi:MAG: SMC-Scp complex subunit ScpB [Pseudomonadota bacterium]